MSCGSLKKLSLNYGLAEINSQAFSFTKDITDIYIPKTVSVLNSSAFSSTDITDIHYDDSKAAWKRLANGATFDNATVHYTLRSEDESVIIHHTDNNFDWEAGNVHLVVEKDAKIILSDNLDDFYDIFWT